MAQTDNEKVKQIRQNQSDQAQQQRAADAEYLKHFRSTYRFLGQPFESFLPAYHYAEEAPDDVRRGRDWPAVEEKIHKDWEMSHPGTWSRCREAIEFGWHKNRQR